MILGIGTDILKIDRIKSVTKDMEDPFIKKTFSSTEIAEARKRENMDFYLATRFAGKEAVFKALSPGQVHVDFTEIEILNRENGEPYVTLHGKLYEHSEKIGIGEVLISLSYDTDYAIAYAIAQNGN